MRVLIACEESGTVRDAFIKKGHDAVSCDLYPSLSNGPHYQGNVLDILGDGWDLMVAHPPCTYLANSGARWLYDSRYPNRVQDREEAVKFVLTLYNSTVPKICIENPIGYLSRVWRKPDQTIHPYMFGDPAKKATCLWLRGLPLLIPINEVLPEKHTTSNGTTYDKWWFNTCRISNLEERRRARSKTFQGIADAMVEQWG